MKRFLVCSVLWSSFLVLCASPGGDLTLGDDHNVCQEEMSPDDLTVWKDYLMPVEPEIEIERDKNFSCLLYPTNTLNCSWSFQHLPNHSQMSVHLSMCQGEENGHYLNLSANKTVGSHSEHLSDIKTLFVIFHFNVSLHKSWIVYSFKYATEMLEVLSPPPNISAAVRDGDLLVTWGLPYTQKACRSGCFEYELDMGDQQGPKTFEGSQSYTEPNADPTHAYKVRMRTRRRSSCLGSNHWSDWSHTVMVKSVQSVLTLNTPVIISISLGVPMILLAVLLLIRHQRVTKVLFPPIPCPPPKYKYFLEKNEPFNLYHPHHLTKIEEEITEVEYVQQNTEKTF